MGALNVVEHQIGQIHAQLLGIQTCKPNQRLGAFLKKGRIALFNGLNLFGPHTEFFAHVIHGQALLDACLMQQPTCFVQHVGIGCQRQGHELKRQTGEHAPKCGIGALSLLSPNGELLRETPK